MSYQRHDSRRDRYSSDRHNGRAMQEYRRDDREYRRERYRSRSRSDERRDHTRQRRRYSPDVRPSQSSRHDPMYGVKSESLPESWEKPVIQKEEPNFEVSGVLAEAQNKRNGVALNFAISVDAAKPDGTSQDWRLFEFLGDSNPRIIKLHDRSCFLFGSDKRLLEDNSDDLCFTLVEHDSCSKQHAAIQFRSRQGSVKPYLLDLDSTNKTYLNGDTVEAGRYIELRHEDVIRFGRCESEYVLMNASLDT